MKKIIILISLFSISVLFSQKKGTTSNKQPVRKSTNVAKPIAKKEETPSPKVVKAESSSSKRSDGFCFSESDKVADFGIGFSGYGIPLHLAGEYFFTDDISGGLAINYSRYSYTYPGYSGSWNFIYGGPKVNYHFNRILKLKEPKADLYAGAIIGYWSGWFSDNSFNGLGGFGNTLYIGLQVGGRYFFTDNIGGFAELGGGNLSAATLGLSLKF